MKKIYKFCTFNDFTRDILITEKFFFNDWEKMNDPLEGFFQYYKTNKTDDNVSDIYTEKNTYGISCFSKDYNEILMWSHYANGHLGICIEVEIDETLCTKNDIDIVDIKYKKDIESIVTIGADVKELLSKKLNKWKYEKEVRVFCKGKKTKHKVGKITKIFLGPKCSSEDKETIEEYIDSEKIKIVQTAISLKTNRIIKCQNQ